MSTWKITPFTKDDEEIEIELNTHKLPKVKVVCDESLDRELIEHFVYELENVLDINFSGAFINRYEWQKRLRKAKC